MFLQFVHVCYMGIICSLKRDYKVAKAELPFVKGEIPESGKNELHFEISYAKLISIFYNM